MNLSLGLLLTLAYFSGSVSSAVLVCRLFTLPDPRVVGSHNPGATNVLRIGGRKAAIATLLGDIVKTALPILIGLWLHLSQPWLLAVGAAALLGHCFPVYFHFQGGKGVASLMTLVILVTPAYGFLALGTWLIVAWTFQRSSLASLVTALVLPLYVMVFDPEWLLPFATLSAIVALRHLNNIANLIKGTEPQIGRHL